MTEKLQFTKSDRQKVWWRSTFLQGSWNYERMQNLRPMEIMETMGRNITIKLGLLWK